MNTLMLKGDYAKCGAWCQIWVFTFCPFLTCILPRLNAMQKLNLNEMQYDMIRWLTAPTGICDSPQTHLRQGKGDRNVFDTMGADV